MASSTSFILLCLFLVSFIAFVQSEKSSFFAPPPPPFNKTGHGETADFEFALVFKTFSINGVNHAKAESQNIKTSIDKTSGTLQVNKEGNDTIHWISELTQHNGTTWAETGNITFPFGGTLFFESIGLSGNVLGTGANLTFGAISYNITGGTGVLSNAYGAMVDTFVSTQPNNASAPFYINAWGLVWFNS